MPEPLTITLKIDASNIQPVFEEFEKERAGWSKQREIMWNEKREIDEKLRRSMGDLHDAKSERDELVRQLKIEKEEGDRLRQITKLQRDHAARAIDEDGERFRFLATSGAQIWYEKSKWTLFLRLEKNTPIQPSATTLAECVDKARAEL